VLFGTVDVPANATMEQLTPFTEQVFDAFHSTPEFSHSFQITFPNAGFGGMIITPWTERKRDIFSIQQEVFGKLMAITGVRAPVFLPPALPSSGIFPVEFVIASTGSHEELVRVADQLIMEAIKSNQFAFPPVTDVRIDQAQAEIVFDREKIGSMGLSMQQVGADLATMLGGNFINRFNMAGRSYKVIAQAERAGRLTPASLGDINVTGPNGTLIPLSSIATFRNGVEPRSLKPLPAAQRREDLRRGAPVARRGATRSRVCGRETSAPGQPLRLHRRIPSASPRRWQVSARHGPRHPAHLPGAGPRSSTRSGIPSSSWPAPSLSRCSVPCCSPS